MPPRIMKNIIAMQMAKKAIPTIGTKGIQGISQ
jgi:hypothetical protein